MRLSVDLLAGLALVLAIDPVLGNDPIDELPRFYRPHVSDRRIVDVSVNGYGSDHASSGVAPPSLDEPFYLSQQSQNDAHRPLSSLVSSGFSLVGSLFSRSERLTKKKAATVYAANDSLSAVDSQQAASQQPSSSFIQSSPSSQRILSEISFAFPTYLTSTPAQQVSSSSAEKHDSASSLSILTTPAPSSVIESSQSSSVPVYSSSVPVYNPGAQSSTLSAQSSSSDRWSVNTLQSSSTSYTASASASTYSSDSQSQNSYSASSSSSSMFWDGAEQSQDASSSSTLSTSNILSMKPSVSSFYGPPDEDGYVPTTQDGTTLSVSRSMNDDGLYQHTSSTSATSSDIQHASATPATSSDIQHASATPATSSDIQYTSATSATSSDIQHRSAISAPTTSSNDATSVIWIASDSTDGGDASVSRVPLTAPGSQSIMSATLTSNYWSINPASSITSSWSSDHDVGSTDQSTSTSSTDQHAYSTSSSLGSTISPDWWRTEGQSDSTTTFLPLPYDPTSDSYKLTPTYSAETVPKSDSYTESTDTPNADGSDSFTHPVKPTSQTSSSTLQTVSESASVGYFSYVSPQPNEPSDSSYPAPSDASFSYSSPPEILTSEPSDSSYPAPSDASFSYSSPPEILTSEPSDSSYPAPSDASFSYSSPPEILTSEPPHRSTTRTRRGSSTLPSFSSILSSMESSLSNWQPAKVSSKPSPVSSSDDVSFSSYVAPTESSFYAWSSGSYESSSFALESSTTREHKNHDFSKDSYTSVTSAPPTSVIPTSYQQSEIFYSASSETYYSSNAKYSSSIVYSSSAASSPLYFPSISPMETLSIPFTSASPAPATSETTDFGYVTSQDVFSSHESAPSTTAPIYYSSSYAIAVTPLPTAGLGTSVSEESYTDTATPTSEAPSTTNFTSEGVVPAATTETTSEASGAYLTTQTEDALDTTTTGPATVGSTSSAFVEFTSTTSDFYSEFTSAPSGERVAPTTATTGTSTTAVLLTSSTPASDIEPVAFTSFSSTSDSYTSATSTDSTYAISTTATSTTTGFESAGSAKTEYFSTTDASATDISTTEAFSTDYAPYTTSASDSASITTTDVASTTGSSFSYLTTEIPSAINTTLTTSDYYASNTDSYTSYNTDEPTGSGGLSRLPYASSTTTSVESAAETPTSANTATGWLPTSIVVATPATSETPIASDTKTSSATSFPSSLPQVIAPETGASDAPPDTQLVQIGFQNELNYPFVAEHSVAAAQIFGFLPLGIAHGLGIDVSYVTVSRLQPYESVTAGYIATVAMVNIPKSEIAKLDAQIHTATSQLYQDPAENVNSLMQLIDSSIPLLPNANDSGTSNQQAKPDDGKKGGGGDGNNSDSNDGDNDKGNGSIDAKGPDSGTAKLSAKTVYITVSAIGAAMVYGGAVFLVFRRNRRKRALQLDSSSSGYSGTNSLNVGTMGAAMAAGGLYHDASSSSTEPGFLSSSSSGLGGTRSGSGSGSRRTGINSILPIGQQISEPVMSENSLGWI